MLFSQKEISHTISVTPQLKTVYFTLNSVSEISIHTTTNQENNLLSSLPSITISAHSEGEYANHFIINEKETATALNIDGDIAFTYPNYQDKLSAHKVHAISVKIRVPEGLQVIVQSDIGNVKVSGGFESFRADLASGNCFLKDMEGNITASSVSGNIYLQANSGKLVTETNSGRVRVVNLSEGTSIFNLKTNNGNITVNRI